MTLKTLALRTKKSLANLYTLGKTEEHSSPPPETPKKYPNTTSSAVTTPDGSSPRFEGSALSPISIASSATDSPSKRVLRRSLRKMRSSFEVLRGKQAEEALSHVVRTPPSKPRPSLALNFEVSPPDKPMFSPDPERYSCNSSRADIHHSSPITVPGSKKNTTLYQSAFPIGTVPDSPAPLNRASVQESMTTFPLRLNDMPMATPSDRPPILTPMPGTNLALEDVQLDPPEIVVSSPSVPLMNSDGYFAIPAAMQGDTTYQNRIAPQAPQAPEPLASECKAPEDNNTARVDNLTATNANVKDDPYALDDAARKSLEHKASFASAYLGYHSTIPAGEAPIKLVRRRSAWSRHTGLYDGTGYASSDCTITEDEPAIQSSTVITNLPESSEIDTGIIEELCQNTAAAIPIDEHGSIIDKNEASENKATSSGSGPGPTIDDNDKESLQDILRAYTVYQDDAKNRRAPGAATATDTTKDEPVQNEMCRANENNFSGRSTTLALVG